MQNVCVQSTRDYGSIKRIGGNRLVNPRNVEVIKASMAEKHLIVPAILNENMEIIDGQHRFEACVELGFPFYFIVVDGYNLKDVQRINANMKNWNKQDFLDSFIDMFKSGHNEYINYVHLINFMKETGLPLDTSVILSDLSKSKISLTEDFKNGAFEFKNFSLSKDIAVALKDFEAYDHNKWKQSTFAKIFAHFYVNERYEHTRMIRNLPFTHDKLSLMGNEKTTITYLVDMYNYRSSKNDKLYDREIADSINETFKEMWWICKLLN